MVLIFRINMSGCLPVILLPARRFLIGRGHKIGHTREVSNSFCGPRQGATAAYQLREKSSELVPRPLVSLESGCKDNWPFLSR
jgi:hypothetical protein